jgi:two-component system sensor histidine kinase AgrC
VGLSIFSVICGIIKIRFSPDTNALLLPLTLICMVIYFVFYKISKQKLWYVFVSVMAVFSFAGLSSYIIEAHINENGKVSDLQTYGLIAQWIVIVGFMIITALMLPKIKWLIDDYHLENVWRFIWLIPMLITVANILMVPQDYSTVNVGRLFEIYIVVDTSFLIFYVLFQFMLYIIAKAVTNKANAEQNAQMLGIQATEYNILTKYIEDTSRLRHDFRQVARTSVRLAKSNDTHALINLLDKYNETVEDSHSQKIFCEHNALNAIVEYYYDEAIQNKIRCNWNIDIPENIKVADVDICSIVGNLLDNAIQGCLTIDEPGWQISFKADIENGDIFIVMTKIALTAT